MSARLSVLTLFLMALLSVLPNPSAAGTMSLFREDVLQPNRSALIASRSGAASQARATQSLFAGKARNSLFAPRAPREQTRQDPIYRNNTGSQVDRVRYIIGKAESYRDGYDAVQHGARIKPSKRPTDMTIGEIYDWIDATPRQPHAIGRYQFIPKTLRRLVTRLGVGRDARFTPRLQDALSDLLLEEAGFHAFTEGAMGRHQFMNNLAKIWAGLPNSTGKSHYHGYAGNKASISWATFDAEMAKIFPRSRQS